MRVWVWKLHESLGVETAGTLEEHARGQRFSILGPSKIILALWGLRFSILGPSKIILALGGQRLSILGPSKNNLGPWGPEV